MKSDPYLDRRAYRALHHAADLAYFRVTLLESDLHIGAFCPLRGQALSALAQARTEVEAAIRANPAFLTSLEPVPPRGGEAPLVRAMLKAAKRAGVGPMAAVAGAIAGAVGRALLAHSSEVIVENGGDLFLCGVRERVVAVFAGDSPLSGKLGVRLRPGKGLGVCTSSGTFGHSLSLGRADAALVVSPDPALADAAATRLGNAIQSENDIAPALEDVLRVPGVIGALAVAGGKVGAKGEIELTAL
ncbi:MAG TPA: UPF0280 family protein [Clostridia bacterium]|jgi:hypothetical protein|nr:MAG: hypothetical protein BWY35_00177 [Firmicutes bacterium ADurb.Bin248]HOG00420.1 UPF0280 family protein [Clostridia bacterium]HOS19074.1 UPF0280 family protein [Clostridia bacterium]HPK15156.1 UPF0280 family protein [Clostridia bacterium]